ncbi:MAG TPA: hypothetical protein VLK57_17205, partial [Pseudonocardia sp.]|nr:hypothetical protein [Pseudonocardia sp.]
MRLGYDRLDLRDAAEPAVGLGMIVPVERDPGQGQVGRHDLGRHRPSRIGCVLDHNTRLILCGVEVAPLAVQQGQVGRRVELRPQHVAGGVDASCGSQVVLRLGPVTGPERGGPGVPQDDRRYHVPGGEAERGEPARILRDLPTGGGDTEEVPSGVPDLDQVQDDAQPLRARAGEAVRTRVGRGGQLPDLRGRALHDAGSGEGGGEFRVAEQRVARHRGQQQVEIARITPNHECEDVPAEDFRCQWPETAAQRVADGLQRHLLVQIPL